MNARTKNTMTDKSETPEGATDKNVSMPATSDENQVVKLGRRAATTDGPARPAGLYDRQACATDWSLPRLPRFNVPPPQNRGEDVDPGAQVTPVRAKRKVQPFRHALFVVGHGAQGQIRPRLIGGIIAQEDH